jgi:hypothetical protein
MNTATLTVNGRLETFSLESSTPLSLESEYITDVLLLAAATARLLRLGAPKVQWLICFRPTNDELMETLIFMCDSLAKLQDEGEMFEVNVFPRELKIGQVLTFTRSVKPKAK